MPITLHWFLPTSGDSRTVLPLGPDGHHRPASIDYLAEVARAAEQNRFHAVLTPTGTWCEDAWLTTMALVRETRRLKFLVAFRPGSITPTLAAQQAATFQRISGGRLKLNIVTGGEPGEQRRFGDWLSHDERYERTDEFLTVLKGAWGATPFDYQGRHYHVEGATALGPIAPVPEIYFGGASDPALHVAARHVDVALAWGEPPDVLATRLDRLRELAAAHKRTLRFGIRLHVITRDRANDAWAETDRFLEQLDPKTVARAQEAFAKSESVGQQNMAALHGGSAKDLVIAPNLWAGYGLVRGGAGTALVGSHDEVADRIEELHKIGFDEFILSGHPHLEEAFWFGEGVTPILRRRGLVVDPADVEPTVGAPQPSVSAYFSAPAAR